MGSYGTHRPIYGAYIHSWGADHLTPPVEPNLAPGNARGLEAELTKQATLTNLVALVWR